MAAEPELTINPDGCRKFEPNPFKKEKCKSCGHPWTSHLGAIDDGVVQGHLVSIRKAAQQKRQAEEAAKAKDRAKKLAKQKQAQAVEDEWLFDGSKERHDSADMDSDDDDMGFRMFTPDTMGSANIENLRQCADKNKPLVVKNLIDFGECDVPEDSPPAISSTTQPKQAAPALPAAAAGLASVAAFDAVNGVMPPRDEDLDVIPGGHNFEQESLKEELEHLRQMLRDANEEKSIQVAIVRDEVIEKQQAIEDITRQRGQAEVSLMEARAEIEALKARLESGAEPNAAPSNQEAQRLVTEVDRLRADLAGAQAEAAEAREQAKTLRSESAALATKLEAATAAAAAADDLRAEIARLKQQLEAAKMVAASKDHAGFDGQSPEEAYLRAVALTRETTDVLRDMRTKGESQLAWIIQRMRENHLDLVGQPLV